jgi:hypothetical protein
MREIVALLSSRSNSKKKKAVSKLSLLKQSEKQRIPKQRELN